MIFVFCLLLVLPITIGAAASGYLYGIEYLQYAWPSATFGSMLFIFICAFIMRFRRVKNFDMIVAGEAVLAMGTYLLVSSIVVLVFCIVNSGILKDINSITYYTLMPYIYLFCEGLACVALGIILSVVLRLIEAVKFGGNSSGGSGGGGIDVSTVNEINQNLKELLDSIKKTEGYSEGISSQTEEIAKNVEKANTNTQNLEGILSTTQKNAQTLNKISEETKKIVEENKTIMEEISSLIKGVSALIEDFKSIFKIYQGR